MSALPPMLPYLTVSDGAAAIEFYKKAFGAVEQETPCSGFDQDHECLFEYQRRRVYAVG
jgi:uncharacterized glyoxalase superfamily protein PhnB